MAINRIQFQPGLSLTTFLEQYGTEASCEAALERWRWPDGFVCPRCAGRIASRFQRGHLSLWQCRDCGHQTSLIAGTVFESTHLPLTTWFQAAFHLTQAKNGVSALELKRLVGVNDKAAWRLKHKLMQVMDERESDRLLHGRVEVDDAYLGGVRAGKPGRGAEGKAPFVIAVETDPDAQRPRFVRLDPLPAFSKAALLEWAKQALAPSALLVSDGLACFVSAGEWAAGHERVVVGVRKRSELESFHWVNTLLGNLKNAIRGTYHSFKVKKYAGRYLAEFQYRFNRRFDLPAMLPRLLRVCTQTGPRPEHWLRSAEEWG